MSTLKPKAYCGKSGGGGGGGAGAGGGGGDRPVKMNRSSKRSDPQRQKRPLATVRTDSNEC